MEHKAGKYWNTFKTPQQTELGGKKKKEKDEMTVVEIPQARKENAPFGFEVDS